MNITDLICVHEARIAHHVAAVGEINGQYCTTTKLNCRRTVTMHVPVFCGAKVTPEKQRFDSSEERWIGGHDVLEFAVLRARLAHDDAAILFHNLSFDFARVGIL